MKVYTNLIAWQKAMDLVEEVYKATMAFPREELYALTIQLRRAAVSIPSNIAEGQGRQTVREFMHFLWIAHGSVREAKTQIRIACRLHYLADQIAAGLIDQASEVGRLIRGLIHSLASSQ